MPDLGKNGDRQNFKVVGQWGIPATASYSIVTGAAKYPADIILPGTLFGDIVRSPYARARIKSMDISKAQALPGVKAIIKWDDEELKNLSPALINQPSAVLPNEGRHERSECGAAVVAETPEICDKAIKLIEESIDWEILPHILDATEAVKPTADLLNPDINTKNNIGGEENFEKGDINEGFSKADKVIDYSFSYTRTGFQKTRPRVCTARWEQESAGNEGESLFFDGYARFVKSTGKSAFKLPDHKVHPATVFEGTIMCEHGGSAAFLLAPIFAKRTGRPVVMLHSRENMFGWCGSGAFVEMKVGFNNDGMITGVYLKGIGDQGSIGHFNTIRLGDALRTLKCPNIKYEIKVAYTNTAKSCMDRGIPYRATALASVIARISDALGMDPTEVALKNCHTPEPSLKACIEAGKAEIGWQWHKAGTKQLPSGKMHGYGFRYNPNANFGLTTVHVGLYLNSDGKIYMPNNEAVRGQFTPDACAMVVAEEMGSRPEDVIVWQGYDMLPFALSSYGGLAASFTWAAKEAAVELREKLLQAAATALKVTPAELDTKDSTVFLKADPSKSYGFGTYAPLEVSFRGRSPNASDATYNTITSVNTIFCEVEVDTETGEVDITNMIGAHDCGKIIRPSSYYGQLEGNMIWNIGFSKMEEYIYDKQTGVLLNGNALDYKMPTILDAVPAVKGVGVETRLGGGAYGASAGVAHQIICRDIVSMAVQNAIGKWIDEPVTPDKVLKALGKV